VGTSLFTQSKGGTALSEAGDHFHALIQGPLRDLYRARVEAQEVAGKADTVLTIAATHALSFTFFPHWILKPCAA